MKHALLGLLATVLCAVGAFADDANLTDLVEIMREEGVIDDTQYAQMRERAQKRESEEHWTNRLQFSGDMRMRFEQFWRSSDSAGGGKIDRTRGRFRARLGLVADINDYVDAVLRIATGENDSRSTNQSLGNNDADFDPDGLYIDRAFLEITPFPDGRIGSWEKDVVLRIGKQPQPWSWKNGKDLMLWDGDLSPEGVALVDTWHLSDGARIFSSAGYFVVEENSGDPDPGLASAQLGSILKPTETLELGARSSFFHFHSLDEDFFMRGVDGSGGGSSTSSGGNLVGGLADSFGSNVNVIEVGTFATCTCFEDWPITLFGNWSQNLSAASSLGASGKQDIAWLIGLQTGDEKKWVQLGVLYAEIEADAFPSQYVDSDLFDGVTNREGWMVYATRQVLENTLLTMELFVSDAIRNGAVYADSVANSDRVRFRTDVEVTF